MDNFILKSIFTQIELGIIIYLFTSCLTYISLYFQLLQHYDAFNMLIIYIFILFILNSLHNRLSKLY